LHFHTPSSFDYANKAVTNEEIVAALTNVGIAAVAITDHHFIDVERIARLRELSGTDLTVFPAIELRTELGGHQSVHMIGIFSEKADASELWTQLQVKLDIMPATVSQKTDEKVWACPLA
jgi:predicted metal-dependent phosphoesterase TrpH